MDERYIINVLIEYQFNIGEPSSNWPKQDFERVAYARDAVDEIIMLWATNPDWTPMRATEEFKQIAADGMKRKIRYREVYDMYRIMYDTANDVTDIINAILP